jgi:acetylornithine deacetylase/succinyl-diaminopimelate desuccinylase-like protein
MFFDIRLLPSVSPDEFDQHLKRLIQETNKNFSNLIIKVARNRMNPSLNTPEDSDLVKAAVEAQRSAGIDRKLDKKATSTEAAQYFAAGYDAIVFGPGKSMGNSHTPNEHNIVDHLDKAVHFYDRMIERFCL